MKRRITLILCAILTLSLIFCASCGDGKQVPESAKKYSYVQDESVFRSFYLSETDGEIPAEQKLIRTVRVSVTTAAYDDFLTALRARMSELGAYASDEEYEGVAPKTGKRSGTRYATLTVRVPTAKTDDFLNAVGGLGTVQSLTSTIDDVTLSYSELAARAETLETEITAVSAMMAGCSTTDELLKVEKRLSELQSELAVITRKLDVYDNQVALSTVYLSIREVEEETEPQDVGPIRRLADNFVKNLKNVGNGILNFAVWLLGVTPYLVLIGAIGVGVFFLLRKITRPSKKKTAAEPEAKPDEPEDEEQF